jgi:hypothetical protein
MYSAPPLAAELRYRGSPLAYDGSIAASYGTDLIEIALAPDLHGEPLTIAFRSAGARFSVQAWKLYSAPRGPGPGQSGEGKARAQTLAQNAEALSGDCSAECRYVLARLDAEQYDRIALIVVRLDPHEEADPSGAYRLTVDAAH